jgi:membrane-associated phospholipid phosphatase
MSRSLKLSLCISFVLLLLGISLYYATTANTYLFRVINNASAIAWIWIFLTTLGNGLFIGCLLFICLRKNVPLLSNALLAGLLVHIASQGGKELFGVLRPEYVIDHIIRLGSAIPMHNYAMPSGHTITAFMALVFLVRQYSLRTWKLTLAIGIAALAGISRVAVGAHWPADCLVGAALGILIATLLTSKSIVLNFNGIRPVIYFFYSVFIIFSAKEIFSSTHSIEHAIIGFIGLYAMFLWVADVYNIIKTKQWKLSI